MLEGINLNELELSFCSQWSVSPGYLLKLLREQLKKIKLNWSLCRNKSMLQDEINKNKIADYVFCRPDNIPVVSGSSAVVLRRTVFIVVADAHVNLFHCRLILILFVRNSFKQFKQGKPMTCLNLCVAYSTAMVQSLFFFSFCKVIFLLVLTNICLFRKNSMSNLRCDW